MAEMGTAEKLIEIAKEEIGYIEGPEDHSIEWDDNWLISHGFNVEKSPDGDRASDVITHPKFESW